MVAPGSTIGDYVLGQRLGSGGFASVWSAKHAATAEAVAIKILHDRFVPASGGDDASVADRFVKEAKLVQSIDHPGLVRILEIIELPQRRLFAYVMEKIDGRDLFSLGGKIDLTNLLEIFARVAETLEDVHAAGVLHRDVKLSNIVVCHPERASSGDAIVKLIDFGVAKDLLALGRGAETTAMGRFVGSINNMAPESCARLEGADVTLTGAVDQWSLGCAMYHGLTGRLPFRAAGMFELITQIREKAPPRIELLGSFGLSECPPMVEKLVNRCLAKKPGERYSSMIVLATALRAATTEIRDPRAGRPLSFLLQEFADAEREGLVEHPAGASVVLEAELEDELDEIRAEEPTEFMESPAELRAHADYAVTDPALAPMTTAVDDSNLEPTPLAIPRAVVVTPIATPVPVAFEPPAPVSSAASAPVSAPIAPAVSVPEQPAVMPVETGIVERRAIPTPWVIALVALGAVLAFLLGRMLA